MAQHTIFGATTPASVQNSDAQQVNLGTAFYITTGSTITQAVGIRFYLDAASNGPTTGYVGYLSSGNSAGALTNLSTVNFTGVAKGGWNTATFSSPVSLSVGTKYWVVVYFPGGCYSATSTVFGSPKQATDGSLLYGAGTSEVSPGNGVFSYGVAGDMSSASTFNSNWYGVDIITSDGSMPISQTEDLENSRRLYWLKTVTTGGNLSNEDLWQAFLKAQTSMPANLSNNDMEKIYWNTKAGTSGLSVQDARRLTFGSANQFSELLWLRAQP